MPDILISMDAVSTESACQAILDYNQVGNVDITIALQKPKLAPHIATMRATLAPILGVSLDCVSVKATTTERLGFVGRCEGCEVWASALITK